VALGRRAFTAFRRHLLHAAIGASLLALCVCCCVAASTAPAQTLRRTVSAKVAASYSSSPAPPKRNRPRAGCARRAKRGAKRASFHSSGGSVHHKHGVKCRRSHVKHKRAQHTAGVAPVPHDGVCAGASLRPSASDLTEVRTATLCLVNRERLNHGESALKADSQLQAAAQGHSDDMAAGDYFEHDGRGGSTPLSRMREAGYIFSSHIGYAVGENIAWATLALSTPQAIVTAWMSDVGHRANILEAKFRDTGIGVSPHPLSSLAHGQAGAIYTQDFGRIILP
jgi:uncharacterized protein YkwD